MIQRTEREVINNEIARMLSEGMSYADIAKEHHVGYERICNIAYNMGLQQRDRKTIHKTRLAKDIPTDSGNTLEDIRKANPYKVGDKVSVRVKINDDDRAVRHNCTVEQVTKHIVFARDENGLMRTVTFAEIGIKTVKGSEVIRKKVKE